MRVFIASLLLLLGWGVQAPAMAAVAATPAISKLSFIRFPRREWVRCTPPRFLENAVLRRFARPRFKIRA